MTNNLTLLEILHLYELGQIEQTKVLVNARKRYWLLLPKDTVVSHLLDNYSPYEVMTHCFICDGVLYIG